jgi:flagellar motor switch protein FliM
VTAPVVRVHDFRRPDLVDRAKMAGLEAILERFARHSSVEVSTLLRTQSTLSLERVEQRAWGDLDVLLPDRPGFVLATLAPLPGSVVLAVPQATVSAMVDLRMGGNGRLDAGSLRELTDIDQALVAPVFEGLLGELGRSFSKVMALRPKLAGQETNWQFVQLAAPTDGCIVSHLHLALGEAVSSGALLIVPVATLAPLLEGLDQVAGPRAHNPGDEPERVDPVRVGETPMALTVRFPKVKVPFTDLLSLAPGAVISLGQSVSTTLDVVVGGVVLAHAEHGSSPRGRVAARIVKELP